MNLQRLFLCLTVTAWLSDGALPMAVAAAPVPEPAPKRAASPYDPTQPLTAPAPDVPKSADQKRPAPGAPASTIQLPAASTSPLTRTGPAPLAANTKSFIWEVKSATNVVYLFGTIHVGKRAFYPLPEPVETAFDNSTRLVVEADVSSQAASGDVASLVGYASPDTLDRHIPIALFERLKAQLVRLRIPTAAVQPMKPFVAGGFLSVVEYSRLGYDMNLGVDAYLVSRARDAKKPIEELESARAQLELLSNMSAELQEAFLDNAISTLEHDKAADQVTGMVNAWQTGDARLMADVTQDVNKGMRLGSQLDEILLYGRHDAMVKKIEGYLAGKEPCFVGVGSLHLVGPRGLVQALKSRGYEVNQK